MTDKQLAEEAFELLIFGGDLKRVYEICEHFGIEKLPVLKIIQYLEKIAGDEK